MYKHNAQHINNDISNLTKMKKEEILILIQEKIRKLEGLADTRNGFEMACKGGAAALRELLHEILNAKEK